MLNINFVKLFKGALCMSLFFSVVSIFCITKYNFDLGLEFTGGLVLEIEYKGKVNIDDVKYVLKDVRDVKVKYYGSKKNIQIKIKKTDKIKEDFINVVKNLIHNDGRILKIDYIGAELTGNIITNSIKAIIISIILMVCYLIVRFNYILAFSAVVALLHNIILVLGLICILNIELDLTVMAALFAVFGYSVNDTIIIFDRIREVSLLYKVEKISIIINKSINCTLSRTLNTSLSTLSVVLILLIFGNEYLLGFSLTIFFGIIIGTYSSIYIATSLLLFVRA